MAKQYYPQEKALTSRIDGQDVCQTLVSETEEVVSWVDLLEDSRKAELRQDPQEIEEVEDPSYQPDSSSEDDSDGDDDESQEEQKVQEKKKPGKIHVKYEKDIAIMKDGLLGYYQFAATSYLCARELGIQSLMQTSSLALRYMTQVGKMQFSMDLKADKELNAVEAANKNEQIEELKHNLESVSIKKSAQKNSSSEEQRGDDETTKKMTDTRKRKPTQKETNSDGKKRRLSPSRAPPESSQAKSDDQELQGKKQDSPLKGKRPAMRSHHKKKACSVTGCKFVGSDLKRHLKLHVKRGEIAEENVAQLATIMTTGKKQRAKSETAYKSGKRKPGRFRKWCPVPECSSILLNVGRHLIQSHGIKKNSIQYKNLLKSVKQYTGLREISMFLEKP